ncbi:hypothetical protein JCM10296v2_003139 [Rhodotorula toruloides]
MRVEPFEVILDALDGFEAAGEEVVCIFSIADGRCSDGLGSSWADGGDTLNNCRYPSDQRRTDDFFPSSDDLPTVPQPTHDLPNPRTSTALLHPHDVPSFAVPSEQYEEFGVAVKTGKHSDAVSYGGVGVCDERSSAETTVTDVSGLLKEHDKLLRQLLQDNEDTRLAIPGIRRDWILSRHEALLGLNKVLAVFFREHLPAQASQRQRKRFEQMSLVKLLPYIQHRVASAARPAAALFALASTTLFLLHPRQRKLIMKVQQASSTPSMTTARTDSVNDPPAAVAPIDVDTSESIPTLERKMHAVHQYYLYA